MTEEEAEANRLSLERTRKFIDDANKKLDQIRLENAERDAALQRERQQEQEWIRDLERNPVIGMNFDHARNNIELVRQNDQLLAAQSMERGGREL